MLYCSDCGERHSTINIVLRIIDGREEEAQLCDGCLTTLTGPVLGPCALCGNTYAPMYRATELEPWKCLDCEDRRRTPALMFPARPVAAELAAAA